MERLIKKIDDLSKEIYSTNPQIYIMMSEILEEIEKIYIEFMSIIPQLNKIGMDISLDGISQQLTTISRAISDFDRVQMYDSFEYEIKDTLVFYNEIKKL